MNNSDEQLPTVINTGTINIDNIQVTVHTLDSGQRVIDARDMQKFLNWLGADNNEQ
ncbi:hypothetical protein [Xenorhabdus sp. BG5]|uniref:hypothetical protein n=1 Tax=Xenorhabdus sp. BG5 TaxID=2782014 RepID=UPI00188081D8|nr:hypothetical protein [Xenorhabdus sp. BG5]MBE8596808.1 hypothetical protein [Xenorhabdus sp. BG5]